MPKLNPLVFLIGFLAAGCIQKKAGENAASLTTTRDSISLLVSNTAKDITAKGSIAWLDYFEHSPEFYMASNGKLEFINYTAADKIVKNILAKQLVHIKLQFADVRVTPLDDETGIVGAVFHEEMTDRDNLTINFSGYFTATAHHTSNGWKYLNIHWSLRDPKN